MQRSAMGAPPSIWNIICALYLFTVEVCEGFSSRKGNVMFQPSPVVPVGSNVLMMCILTEDPCNRRGVFKYDIDAEDNYRDPDWANETMSVVQLTNVRRQLEVECYLKCSDSLLIVHMAQLQVGYPPERPTNILCLLKEQSSNIICSWDIGQETYLPTSYDVRVTNLQTGHRSLQTEKINFVRITVNRTRDEIFLIQITARNPLNSSASDELQIHLSDIVVPNTPIIKDIRILPSTFNISITWRDGTSESCCELQYRTLNGSSWLTVGEQNNQNNTLEMVHILTAYSLRVRCRGNTGQRYWSDWSPAHLMPLSAPMNIPDVWRILGPEYPNGTREVTILIRPDESELPQRAVIGYKVFYWDRETSMTLRTCNLSEKQCVTVIPKSVKMVYVSGYNLNGSSPASELALQEEDSPQPWNLTLTQLLQSKIRVQWQRSPTLGWSPPRSYVLQWNPDSCEGKTPHLQWQSIRVENRELIIDGRDFAGRRVAVSLYAVYSSGVSRLSRVNSYTAELRPERGPESITIENLSSGRKWVRWSEVPVCQQRGFITLYTVYVMEQARQLKPIYNTTLREAFLESFNPNWQYLVCVSASTKRGEGPYDSCAQIEPDKSLQNYFGSMLGICLGGATLTMLVLALSVIRKRIKAIFILWLPKYLQEEYPKVEQSSAAKSLKEKREDPESHFSPIYSDPEITDELELLPREETEHVVEDFPSLLSPTADDDTVDLVSGYRPQAPQTNSPSQDPYFSPSDMLDFPIGVPRPEHPTVIPNTNTGTVIDLNFFLDKNLLLLNTDQRGDSSMADMTEHSIGVSVTELTELCCHVLSDSGELCNTKSYFPQVFATEASFQGVPV